MRIKQQLAAALLVISLLLLGRANLLPGASSSPMQEDNLLQNGDFEGGFSQREAAEVIVATGWEYWWQEGTEEEQRQGYLRRPEYRPDSTRASGTQQEFFTNYATHHAGIYQRASVPEGSLLTLTARVYVWSSNKDDYDRSEQPGDYGVMLGIDPTGGTDPLASTVVWSPPWVGYDHWMEVGLEATAQADAVTVFLGGTAEYRVKHNHSYWDDVALTALEPTATPTSTPTFTPTPTATPPPVSTVIPSDAGGSLTSNDTYQSTTIIFPPLAVPSPGVVITWAHQSPTSTGDLLGIGHFFDLQAACPETGQAVTFTKPVTVAVRYREEERRGAVADTLGLYWLSGTRWITEGIATVLRTAGNVTSTTDHFTLFAVLGETNRTYMPVVLKNR